MHLVRDLYHDVTDIKTVEVPEEFFSVTFIRQLMLGPERTSTIDDRVRALHQTYAFYRFNGSRYKGDLGIDTYRAMKYLEDLKSHLIENLESFMNCSVFALYDGLSVRGRWAIINGITNDHQDEAEIECFGAKTSYRCTYENSVICAAIQEHLAVLGLVNPAEKVSEMKRDTKRFTPSFCAISCT